MKIKSISLKDKKGAEQTTSAVIIALIIGILAIATIAFFALPYIIEKVRQFPGFSQDDSAILASFVRFLFQENQAGYVFCKKKPLSTEAYLLYTIITPNFPHQKGESILRLGAKTWKKLIPSTEGDFQIVISDTPAELGNISIEPFTAPGSDSVPPDRDVIDNPRLSVFPAAYLNCHRMQSPHTAYPAHLPGICAYIHRFGFPQSPGFIAGQ